MYQGYSCTEKYIRKPVTTQESLKSVAEFPDLRLSICKQFSIQECRAPDIPDNIFNEYIYEFEEDCVFPRGSVPNYAASYEQFWTDLENRKLTKKTTDGDEVYVETDIRKVPHKIAGI